MEFKYKAEFISTANLNHGRWREAIAKNTAFASLSDLRSLLPPNEEIEDNPDLLYTSFNVAVVNLANANGHAIGTETALAVSKYFVDRHVNVEHCKYDIVGHIISQGFSTFNDNKIISAEEASKLKIPFNISLGAVVYKLVQEYVSDLIKESADPDNDWYQSLSTSWEIGFNEYDIAMGSFKLADATIVSDEEKIIEYSPYLKMNGGTGLLPDGTPVYCVIKGDARPLGCGVTGSPAGQVKGMYVPEVEEDDDDDKEEHDGKRKCKANQSVNADEFLRQVEAKFNDVIEKIEKNIKNNSQNTKITVNTNMKLKSINDITPEFLQVAEASKEVRDFITEELNNASKAFADEKKVLEDARVTLETELKQVQASLEKAQEEAATFKTKLEEKEKQEVFDARMEEISSTFDLNAEQNKAVASEIFGLDDNGFATWKSRFELYVPKKKSNQNGDIDDDAAQMRKASASTPAPLPNSLSPSEPNLVEDMLKSLTETIEIK